MSAAAEYGRALFLLSDETDTREEVARDVQVMLGALKDNPELIKLLDTPAISKEERLGVVDSSFGTLCESVVNLSKILCEKHSFYLMPGALQAYLGFYDEAQGIERAEALSAVPLTVEQLEKLRLRLEKETGKTIIIKNTVDPSLLGGIKLRYMGVQLDGSVKTRLDGFKRALSDVVI